MGGNAVIITLENNRQSKMLNHSRDFTSLNNSIIIVLVILINFVYLRKKIFNLNTTVITDNDILEDMRT